MAQIEGNLIGNGLGVVRINCHSEDACRSRKHFLVANGVGAHPTIVSNERLGVLHLTERSAAWPEFRQSQVALHRLRQGL
jgi:hypothetical protein